MKNKLKKVLSYFGLSSSQEPQEEVPMEETEEQDDSKVVPMFGSGSSWREKATTRKNRPTTSPMRNPTKSLMIRYLTRIIRTTAKTTARNTAKSTAGTAKRAAAAAAGTKCFPCR